MFADEARDSADYADADEYRHGCRSRLLLGWSFITVVLIGTLFIFNSTAVVSEYLRKNGELHSGLWQIDPQYPAFCKTCYWHRYRHCSHFFLGGACACVHDAASVAGSVIIFLLLRSIRNRDFFSAQYPKTAG